MLQAIYLFYLRPKKKLSYIIQYFSLGTLITGKWNSWTIIQLIGNQIIMEKQKRREVSSVAQEYNNFFSIVVDLRR